MNSTKIKVLGYTEFPTTAKVAAASDDSAAYMSKKDYGLKFKVKGAELKRKHDAYRAESGMTEKSSVNPTVMATGREAIIYLPKREYGIKFKLTGSKLKRAHEKYRAKFGFTDITGLAGRPKITYSDLPNGKAIEVPREKAPKKCRRPKKKKQKGKLWLIYTAFYSAPEKLEQF